eukprot:gb/GFBE01058353.1/.p1 GENE.gb/GFBE01058353.1/~~gb/GFBE01058353.1/.p1  ORF type:complete len:248 (+),score=77.60 gb/GFBE01058353.1/:1-744(+)
MAPQRSKMLPVLVGACACAALLHGAAFVGFTGASMQAPGEVGRSVNVAMRNKLARKWIKSPEQKNFISAKDKQSKIAKDKQGKADKKKAVGEMEWPVQIPEGVTLLHVEYDQRLRDKPFGEHRQKRQYYFQNRGKDWFEGKPLRPVFPKPGNLEVQDFYRKIQTRYGPKVQVIINQPKALEALSPAKDFRGGAFEVVNVNTGELLWSKLQHGPDCSLVHGDEAWWNHFQKKLDAAVEQVAQTVDADA